MSVSSRVRKFVVHGHKFVCMGEKCLSREKKFLIKICVSVQKSVYGWKMCVSWREKKFVGYGHEFVWVCVCGDMLTSSANSLWLSNGYERVWGEDETIEGPRQEPSYQRTHPVHVVVSPWVVVVPGGHGGRPEAPSRVERASGEGVTGVGQGERRVHHSLRFINTNHQPMPRTNPHVALRTWLMWTDMLLMWTEVVDS